MDINCFFDKVAEIKSSKISTSEKELKVRDLILLYLDSNDACTVFKFILGK